MAMWPFRAMHNAFATVDELAAVDAASLKIAANGSDIVDEAAFRANLSVAPWLGRAPAAGDYSLVSAQPEDVLNLGTSTYAKNQWRYCIFQIDTAWSVDQLAIVTNVAASGGTAAGLFGLFALDANNKPAELHTDLSSFGSIDLTAAAGTLTLTTEGLIIPAGKWAIGFGWDGTAGVNPVGYSVLNQMLGVGTTTIGPLTNTGYFSNQSGASVPANALPSAAAVSGIAVWARNA